MALLGQGALAALLAVRYFVSRGWLSIDPNFAPLRGDTRFETLLQRPIGS